MRQAESCRFGAVRSAPASLNDKQRSIRSDHTRSDWIGSDQVIVLAPPLVVVVPLKLKWRHFSLGSWNNAAAASAIVEMSDTILYEILLRRGVIVSQQSSRCLSLWLDWRAFKPALPPVLGCWLEMALGARAHSFGLIVFVWLANSTRNTEGGNGAKCERSLNVAHCAAHTIVIRG